MNPNIERLKLLFIGLFLVAAIGVGVWQVWWVMPAQKCEKEQKKWWDPVERVCATPVLTSDYTGRLITDAQALAEARKAIGRDRAAAAPAPAPKN